MKPLSLPIAGLALLVGLAAAPAAALTPEQVLSLKKAGVSEQTIRAMLDAETAVKGHGGVGRYLLRESGGRQWIVYEARSPLGSEEYPINLRMSPAEAARAAAALSAERRAYAQPRNPAPGYTLNLGSYRKKFQAERRVRRLAEDGITTTLTAVDLPGNGRWYRVLVAGRMDQEQAEALGQRLEQEGKITTFSVIKP